MVCRGCRSLETGNRSWGSLATLPKRAPGEFSSSEASLWSRTAHPPLQETFLETIRGQHDFQLVGSEAALTEIAPQLSGQALQLLPWPVLLHGVHWKLSRETGRTTTYRAISALFIPPASLSWLCLRYFRVLEPVPHNLLSIPAAGRCVFLPTSPARGIRRRLVVLCC